MSAARRTGFLVGLAAAGLLLAGLVVAWVFLGQEFSPARATSARDPGAGEEVAAPAPGLERAEVSAEGHVAQADEAAEQALEDAPVPEGKVRVRGSVVDLAWPPRGWPEERPVGLEVILQGLGEGQHEVRTGAGGRFEMLFDDPGERPWFVLAHAVGDERRAGEPVHEELADGQRSVDLHLVRKPHGDLTGRVVDVEGTPLAGVLVSMQRSTVERHEAVTDAQGGFTMTWLPKSAGWQFAAERSGHALLHWTELTRADAGGWEPVVLTMTRTGAVEVQVLGPDGAPAAGVTVGVGLARSETGGRPDLMWGDAPGATAWTRSHAGDLHRLALRRETDADGLARFSDVWADRRLLVAFLGTERRRTAERHLRGELLLDQEPGEGEAIHVPPGGLLALRAQPFGARARLEGRVTTAGGQDVPGASVTVVPLGREEGEGFVAHARAGGVGRYALELGDVRAGETLRIRATDGRSHRPGSEDHRGVTEVVVTGGELRGDVVIAPALSISGRIRDAEGNPLRGWLRARPGTGEQEGDGLHADSLEPEGRFELAGLEAGTYELALHRQLEVGGVVHRFPGIPAGASGLELVAEAALDVTLAVRIEAPRPLGSYRLLVAQQPDPDAPAGAWPEAPASQRCSRVGWPAGACITCTGNMPVHADGIDLVGYFHRGRGQGVAFPHLFEGLARGLLVVGVVGEDADGRPFAPVLASPARYEAGTHELTFVLRSAAGLRGRVLDVDPGLELWIEARDAEGIPLPLADAGNKAASRLPLPADGRFVLERLPVGEMLLRVGTRVALAQGGTVLEHPLELAADETTPVELRWR